MNIAMLVYSHYSRDARVRRYAETLAKHNFRVDVISLKEKYEPKGGNIALTEYPLPRRRFGRLWYILEYLLFFIFATLQLTIKTFTRKYKIIHIHNMPDFFVFTVAIPKLLGAKVILDMHDIMPELYMSKYQVNQKDWIVKSLIFIEKLSFAFADYIITANHEFKKIFLSRKSQKDKISVILNCPDEKIFKPTTNLPRPASSVNGRQAGNQQPTTIFTLLYMGTVEERFGLDIAIEGVLKLKNKIPRLRFIIIPKIEAEGEYFNLLKKKIINLGLSEHILILKPLPLEQIAEKLKTTDIGIVLAKNGIFTDSIFPVKFLEFVQMDVPVIATKTQVLSKYFDNNSISFLKENTPKEFAQAVFALWKNKSLRKTLTQNAKNYLKKYNWEKEEKKYLRLISNFCH